MEIQKGFNKLLLTFYLLTILLQGCDNVTARSGQVESLKKENYELRKESKQNQVLLNSWFNEFSSIQSELNSINTDEIILLEYGFNEHGITHKSDKEKALNKIKKIKLLLDKREQELKSEDIKYSGLYNMISNLRKELNNKERIIQLLKSENQKIKEENRKISTDLEHRTEEVYNLKEEIEIKNLALNTKYLFLVSAKESTVQEVNETSIRIPYKIKDIEVLSYHPSNSFKIYKTGNHSILKIVNINQFWNNTENIIIRIKKRHL